MTPGNDAAIETLGLRKTYRTLHGRAVGVDRLDLRVPSGGLHALLGAPGSGRTTTLRLLTGLARADSGAIKIFGVPVPDGLPELAGRIGAVVGEPGFEATLSGARNLALLAGAARVPRSRVDEVLARVVLTDRAKAAYGTYSPHESRRLALAAALLRAPDLLVVDEPTAGLDAVGTREMRQALRRLADQGTTVLVATGVLAEAQQIADTVTVLDGGRALAQGAVPDLLGDAAVTVRVRLDDPAKGATVLRAAGFAVRSGGDVLHVDAVTEPADITRALARQKLFPAELVPQREDLGAVVGRLRPVVPPAPKPLSRAEERAERRRAARQAAERKKAADQRKAAKAAVAAQAAAQARAAQKEAAEKAAAQERAAAKAAAKAGAAEAGAAEAGAAEAKAARKVTGGGSKGDAKAVPPKPAPPASKGPGKAARQEGAPGAATAGPAPAAKPSAVDEPPRQSLLARRRAEFDAKVAKRQAAAETRIAQRQEAADAKAARKQEAADAKAARKQEAADAKAARKQEAADARSARKKGGADTGPTGTTGTDAKKAADAKDTVDAKAEGTR
ncbi:ATP-binding cassette domain-containing protein [Promicromonospora thailandica]|uniref:ABC-type multidrug transport system, ATPase component n=1 Tax=Promicromonospora thailandica TaxID=765201 RepID=A0A9X2JYL9_9MICO|nr:ATP-binding cassette domain-containing protein [Promicromonospora thailandica]MCP2267348.1 ABC-type multidrug transport system, ATPase component [Promicromonospora thailandica]